MFSLNHNVLLSPPPGEGRIVFTDYESLALYYSCHHVYTEAEAAANEGVVAGTCEPGREAVYFLSRKPSPIHVLLRMYSVTLRKLCVLPANMELINHYCESLVIVTFSSP